MKGEINRVIMAKLESRLNELNNINCNSILGRGNVGARAKVMNAEKLTSETSTEKVKAASNGKHPIGAPLQQE